MFCVIKSMRFISKKSKLRTGYSFFERATPKLCPIHWLRIYGPKPGRRRSFLGPRSIEKSSGRTGPGPDKFEKFRTQPDQPCFWLYFSCRLVGRMYFFLFFRNFGRDFLMIIFLKWFLVFFQEKWRLFEVSFPRCHFRKCENPSERKFFGNFENYFA